MPLTESSPCTTPSPIPHRPIAPPHPAHHPARPRDLPDLRRGRLDRRRQWGGGEEEAAAPASPTAPRIVRPDELREAANTSEVPIYWADERPGAALELSEPSEGRASVRYLAGEAEAGDPEADFLTAGTYRLPHAYEDLKASAVRSGAKLRKAPRGAMAWQDPDSPTSVYLSKPGVKCQVEVYDPSSEKALKVACPCGSARSSAAERTGLAGCGGAAPAR